MKKIYLIPQTIIVKVGLKSRLLEGSLGINNITYEGDAMVKENPTSRSNYNVWNDDWSD